jgi:hypothetical protein
VTPSSASSLVPSVASSSSGTGTHTIDYKGVWGESDDKDDSDDEEEEDWTTSEGSESESGRDIQTTVSTGGVDATVPANVSSVSIGSFSSTQASTSESSTAVHAFTSDDDGEVAGTETITSLRNEDTPILRNVTVSGPVDVSDRKGTNRKRRSSNMN